MSVYKTLSVVASLFFAATLVASPAAENTVEFADVSKFTDFRIESMPMEKNIKVLKDDLQRQLTRSMARYLPEGNTMQITITDVDMAGQVVPGQQFRRVLQNLEKAQLSFSYRWLNAEGEQVSADEVDLLNRNLQNLSSQAGKYNSSSFAYETAMFDRWLYQLTRNN